MSDYHDYRYNSAMTWVNLLSVGTEYTFEEVSLLGNAHLVFEADHGSTKQRTVMIQKLIGEKSTESDRFAYIHVGPYQMIIIRQAEYYLPLNTHVYPKGSLNLPEKVMLYQSDHIIDGAIGGAYDLSVAQTRIAFGRDAHSITTVGNVFIWEKVSIMADGVMDFRGWEGDYEVRTDVLDIAAHGTLLGRRLSIKSDSVRIAERGVVNVDFGGHDDNGRGKVIINIKNCIYSQVKNESM